MLEDHSQPGVPVELSCTSDNTGYCVLHFEKCVREDCWDHSTTHNCLRGPMGLWYYSQLSERTSGIVVVLMIVWEDWWDCGSTHDCLRGLVGLWYYSWLSERIGGIVILLMIVWEDWWDCGTTYDCSESIGGIVVLLMIVWRGLVGLW